MEIDMLNNKRKKRILIIAFSNILCFILILLIFYVFQTAIQKNISIYQENQNLLAASFLNSAVSQASINDSDITVNLITAIKSDFPTSSSVYCIVTKNNQIAFYKDDNTTSTVINESIDNYLQNNISLRDNNRYLLSKSEIQYHNDSYSLTICTKEIYYLKKIKLLEIRLYCMGFFFLFGAMMIVILIYNLYKLSAEEKNNTILKKEIRKNRQLIELLENDKNKHYVNSEKEFSFYNRSIIEEVIVGMTKEELKKCIQIDIIVENSKMEHFIFITAILGRIKGDNSIASYWEKNQFKILLLNSNKKEATDFVNLFINKYKSESEEKVEELKVVASKITF
jgi:hypothetical protein